MQDKETLHTNHAICFYFDMHSFLRSFLIFTSRALQNPHEVFVVFISKEYQEILEKNLTAMGFKNKDQLILLNDAEALSAFMENGLPHKEKFNKHMDTLIKSIPKQYSIIRFYGTLTDSLWQAGNKKGAQALESLYNDFVSKNQSVTILCLHERGSMQELYNMHGEIIPDEDYLGCQAQLRMLTDFHDNSLALETVTRQTKNLKSFIPVLCHDIRNFGHIIRGMTELVKLDLPPNLALGEIQEYLSTIISAVDNQTEILEANLDLAKLEEGKLQLTNGKVSFKSILKDIEKIFKVDANQKGIELKMNLPHDDITVKGDKTRLKQILTNLITNAIKYTHKGHVWVTLSYLTQNQSHTQVEVSVEDTGIGLTEEEIKNIGHRFDQFTAHAKGWGLGLFLSMSLISAMQGKLTITSQKDIGSTFRCVFTFENSNSPLLRIPRSANNSPLLFKTERKKALIADHNEISRKILEKYLKDDYECHFALNGLEAIQKQFDVKYDIILIAMIMPTLDGFTAIKVIRANDANIPIIALSENPIDNYPKHGINECLTMPITKQDIDKITTPFLYRNPSSP